MQEFDNFIKENQNKAKEFSIGSNMVVLEINEDTTKYEVSQGPRKVKLSSNQILIVCQSA